MCDTLTTRVSDLEYEGVGQQKAPAGPLKTAEHQGTDGFRAETVTRTAIELRIASDVRFSPPLSAFSRQLRAVCLHFLNDPVYFSLSRPSLALHWSVTADLLCPALGEEGEWPRVLVPASSHATLATAA